MRHDHAIERRRSAPSRARARLAMGAAGELGQRVRSLRALGLAGLAIFAAGCTTLADAEDRVGSEGMLDDGLVTDGEQPLDDGRQDAHAHGGGPGPLRDRAPHALADAGIEEPADAGRGANGSGGRGGSGGSAAAMPTSAPTSMPPSAPAPPAASVVCPSGFQAFERSCYRVSTLSLGWLLARTECLTSGADLVSIESAVEDRFVGGLVAESIWIGASDLVQDGVYTWADGRPVTFTNWGPGQPDEWADQDCIEKRQETGEPWYDQPCERSLRYVCERAGTSSS